MGDKEQQINYTPEELEEIDRIVEVIDQIGQAPGPVEPESALEAEPVVENVDDEFFMDEPVGEPGDLDLPLSDMDDLSADELSLEEPGPDFSGQEETEIDEADLPEIPIEDITDLSGEAAEDDLPGLDDFDTESTDDVPSFDDIATDQAPVEEPAFDLETPPDSDVEESAGDTSVDLEEFEPDIDLDQIGEDTEEGGAAEPDTVSDTDEGAEEKTSLEELDEFATDETADLGDFPDSDAMPSFDEVTDEPPVEGPGIDQEVSIQDDGVSDIPDLTDLDVEEAGDLPEAIESDIPDIDLGGTELDSGVDQTLEEPLDDMGGTAETTPAGDELDQFDDIPDLGPELGDLDDIPGPDVSEDDMPEIDLGDQQGAVEPDAGSYDEPLSIEPLDDAEPAGAATPPSPGDRQGESIELSDRELNRLKKAIVLYNPAVRQAVKETVINDLLPVNDVRQLVNMILSGKPEKAVHSFLEKKLNRKIRFTDEGEAPQRRIITSRPEYTIQGRIRQEKLLKKTKIGAIVLGVLLAGFLAGYQLIYKPYKAKNLIEEGVALIHSKEYKGDEKKEGYASRIKNFNLAEDKFDRAYKEYLDHDDPYGYHAFSRAYLQEKYYDRSLKKLNKIYSIYFHEQKEPVNLETLNSLGEFYTGVSDVKFKEYQPDIKQWYYDRASLKDAKDRSKLDLSIQFFRRVLARDKNNNRALYGIGNAYYVQGQVRMAKDYYRQLTLVNEDSINGYAGLLNLYIEEDLYADVENVRSAVMEQDLMPELPSPLLAKLASYYLDKRKTKDFNIRIDHGVQSKRIKDIDDNTYPAVLMVLKVLNRRDPDYPPLFFQYARLHKAQKNYAYMKRYLEKAIERAPNYYAALHMFGEYYYLTREPAKAYEYFNRAIKSYYNQPAFTREMFYKETEHLGKTYLLQGNIFYYFQDETRYRFGDLDDVDPDKEMDRLNNNDIAREKYMIAEKLGFSNSELKYNLGRIFYLKKLYRDALDQWHRMYGEYIENPQLRFALGNAYYHLGQYEESKGEFLKLISVFEDKADRITVPIASNREHITVYQTLSSAYNNLGAVYRMQNDNSRSGVAFWKSTDYAKRIERDNALARVNLARSFQQKETDNPIIDENIPYSIDMFENLYEKSMN